MNRDGAIFVIGGTPIVSPFAIARLHVDQTAIDFTFPVTVSLPEPGIRVDSICSNSPPTSVQAIPVDKPMDSLSSA